MSIDNATKTILRSEMEQAGLTWDNPDWSRLENIPKKNRPPQLSALLKEQALNHTIRAIAPASQKITERSLRQLATTEQAYLRLVQRIPSEQRDESVVKIATHLSRIRAMGSSLISNDQGAVFYKDYYRVWPGGNYLTEPAHKLVKQATATINAALSKLDNNEAVVKHLLQNAETMKPLLLILPGVTGLGLLFFIAPILWDAYQGEDGTTIAKNAFINFVTSPLGLVGSIVASDALESALA